MRHELIDQRSLELHRAVVRRLMADPALFDVAKRNLERWLAKQNLSSSLERIYQNWLRLLNSKSQEEIITLLLADNEEGRLLRQNSPFAGVLSPREVQEIKDNFANAAR